MTRSVRTLASFFGLLALGATSFGCSDESGEEEPDTAPATETTPDQNTMFNTRCEDSTVTQRDRVAPGLAKIGDRGLVRLEVISSDPLEPSVVPAGNAWTFRLRLAESETLLNDASIIEVYPFMPDHGHGTSVQPVIGATDRDGIAEISNLDFRMPGVWTVRVSVQLADGAADDVQFAVCVES